MGQKKNTSSTFVLAVKDPFAEGALRSFAAYTGKNIDKLSLPFSLDAKRKAGRAAIENYIVRARGADRHDLADAAALALAGKAVESVVEHDDGAGSGDGAGSDDDKGSDLQAEYDELFTRCLKQDGTPRSSAKAQELQRLAELKHQLENQE